jgi:hypothetical protein
MVHNKVQETQYFGAFFTYNHFSLHPGSLSENPIRFLSKVCRTIIITAYPNNTYPGSLTLMRGFCKRG